MTIAFNINLPWGWAKNRSAPWFSSWAHGEISENKAWEWQTEYLGWTTVFDIGLDLIPTGGDHAGVGISLTVLGFMVEAKIYDKRHWDEDNNTWEKYDEESMRARMSRDEQRRHDEVENARNLLKFDDQLQNRKELEEFLETPQGQAMIDQRVQAKLEEQRTSKEAKAARGEQYRRANLGKISDDEAHDNAKGNGQ
jgi:hypothetical protein